MYLDLHVVGTAEYYSSKWQANETYFWSHSVCKTCRFWEWGPAFGMTIWCMSVLGVLRNRQGASAYTKQEPLCLQHARSCKSNNITVHSFLFPPEIFYCYLWECDRKFIRSNLYTGRPRNLSTVWYIYQHPIGGGMWVGSEGSLRLPWWNLIPSDNDKVTSRVWPASWPLLYLDWGNMFLVTFSCSRQLSLQMWTSIWSLLTSNANGHLLVAKGRVTSWLWWNVQVIQGLLQGHKDTYHTKDSILRLFIHECLRVYGDRMWDPVDRQWLKVLKIVLLKVVKTVQLQPATCWLHCKW